MLLLFGAVKSPYNWLMICFWVDRKSSAFFSILNRKFISESCFELISVSIVTIVASSPAPPTLAGSGRAHLDSALQLLHQKSCVHGFAISVSIVCIAQSPRTAPETSCFRLFWRNYSTVCWTFTLSSTRKEHPNSSIDIYISMHCMHSGIVTSPLWRLLPIARNSFQRHPQTWRSFIF